MGNSFKYHVEAFFVFIAFVMYITTTMCEVCYITQFRTRVFVFQFFSVQRGNSTDVKIHSSEVKMYSADVKIQVIILGTSK